MNSNHENEYLLHAVQTGKVEDVRTSLERRGNPNYAESDGYSLLHWACQEGFIEVAEVLVEYGANVNAVDDNGMTPLYNAAGSDFEVVKALVEWGADVNNTQHIGAPLHNAVAWEKTEIVELLLDAGADANAMDDDGQTPLFCAATAENAELASLLILHGADIHHQDNEGKIPLDIVIEQRNEALARFHAMSDVLA